ncbi:EAP30/Vps36 family-domain-containing protein [Thamnocephalis sphaerospora]|uniref:Vacuolar protein-sorting-associated protein 36 n=1 Tax=Thamnocephalis sphaerospora TaxID=78915 RepID=A0A4P9XNP1_9FUNG|nr:EAP30/Vps36 family-domain-containing protein [Thamnocephalis sphaerospora]|eukprot:RKP06860.1 EAP30/Vps36 family-domain-containing protein [Thamnocephalis sphaerospora]
MSYFDAVPLPRNSRDAFPLLAQETVLLAKAHVGLYLGKTRSVEFDDGTVYLTNRRIVYVDERLPRAKRFALALSWIERADSYASSILATAALAAGFINSSPKVTMYLRPRTTCEPSHDMADMAASMARLSVTTALDAHTSNGDDDEWACPICACPNPAHVGKCRLCGSVRRSPSHMGTRSTAAQRTSSPLPSISVARDANTVGVHTRPSVTAMASHEEDSGIACPVCTFLNHVSMVQCEMCESALLKDESSGATAGEWMDLASGSTAADSSQPRIPDCQDATSVRYSFRDGGQPAFMALLRRLLQDRPWEQLERASDTISPVAVSQLGGINGLLQAIDQTSHGTEKTLISAFADLDSLMAKAAEMVTLAETIASRLDERAGAASAGATSSKESNMTLASLLTQLDIQNPVTKDTAGSAYYEELACEFSGFLAPMLASKAGAIALADAYCLFNRARGIELVSPQDLRRACDLAATLGLPMRIRRFASGLLAVQHDIL